MRLSIGEAVVLAWVCGVGAAGAADLGDKIAGHAGLTYFDLMKLVVTDLAPAGPDGARGRAVVPFRHIEGANNRTDPPETITIASVDVLPVPDDPSRIVLLADVGATQDTPADASVLALFVLSPQPRLLDAVEVGTDRDVGFASDTKPVILAPRTPLILISSGHDNSNQSYRSTAMIFIRDNRFQLIDSVFTFGEAYCSSRRTQEPLFSALAAPGPYRALQVRVREQVTVSGEDCNSDGTPPRAGTRFYRAIYRWDGLHGRFATRSKELDRLAADNAKRF